MIVKGAKINDRYQIIKTLGEGGMANVYLAHDTILDRDVAVKVLRGDLASDEKFVRRFQREALSASSLSHPNIVEMYDVGEDNGQYYIVMEYVDGKTLKQVLKQRGHLSITEVIDIMLQLTDGMAHAHDAYIIHRDIKPQNIMILSNGVIKITDFGVATALNSTQLTQTNSVMGTVHYLPPEQAQGKGSTIRSDIYSMGIMMYELLTGLVPYKGENAVEIALKHLKEPLPSVRKQNSSIPQSIENVIIRATAKNPKNRYADSREMHEDIKTALDESRSDERRYVYKYAENDFDETKSLDKEVSKVKEEIKPNKTNDEENEEEDFMGNKKSNNKLLIVLLSIFTAIVLVVAVGLPILLKNNTVEDAKIPDVKGKSVEDATKLINKEGFEVNAEYKYIVSEDIEEGLVVKTSPEIGSLNKVGKEIIIYLSSGAGKYIVEDFSGQNYLEAKGSIEAQCNCTVNIEKETVEDEKDYKVDTVIRTSPEAGKGSPLGNSITIYVAEIEYKYPDFTDGYTISKLEEFVKKHNLKLQYKYVTDDSKEEGTIIKQNRAFDSVVTPNASLIITVTTKSVSEDEEDTEGEETESIDELVD